MHVPEVLTYPDKRLRTKSSEIVLFDSELKQLLQDLQYPFTNLFEITECQSRLISFSLHFGQ